MGERVGLEVHTVLTVALHVRVLDDEEVASEKANAVGTKRSAGAIDEDVAQDHVAAGALRARDVDYDAICSRREDAEQSAIAFDRDWLRDCESAESTRIERIDDSCAGRLRNRPS